MLTRKQMDEFLVDYAAICKKHGIVVGGYDDGPFLVEITARYNPLHSNISQMKKCSGYKNAYRT